jgi:hypothetical protein
MKAKDIPPAWATAYDKFGDPSGVFAASREGLLYLRDRIDEALAKGDAAIGSDARFDFERIAISDTHPSRTLKPRPILDKIMGVLGTVLILAVIVLTVYGAHALYSDITK